MEKKTPVQRFWGLLKPDKKEIKNVYIYAVFNGLVMLTLPLGIQSIINHIQGGQINFAWGVLVGFVLLGVALSGILQIHQLRIVENLQQKIFTRAAFEFAYRMPKLKLEKLFGQYAPELMNRFFDVVAVQKGLSKILIDFSTAFIQVIFGLLLLSLYHPFFIGFGLILIILAYLIFKFTAQAGLDSSLKESKSKYEVVHWLEELARTKLTFKLAGETDLPLRKVDKSVSGYLTFRERHFKILMQQFSLMIVFKVMIASGLLIIGSVLVMEQQMNIGQFVASEIIILLILNSVEKLIQSLESIYDILTSLEKIGFVTDLEMEDEGGRGDMKVSSETGVSLDIRQLYFSYPERIKPVLNNLTLNANSNESLLIFGRNDSGKATLFKLISGLYNPQGGNISIDDMPINSYDLTYLRNDIGEYYSDDVLFEATLLENISLGRERATMECVKWAVKNVGLEDFIKSQPQGYQTIVTPGGFQYPRSVITRLLLARAIAARPKLLLLRDGLATLNPVMKDEIMRFLTDKKNNWTVIFFSSNTELAKYVDNVAVMSHGFITKKVEPSELNNPS
tara:strand:- start:6433 stop:8127 length:1695 start_codon:yes stop_codon:yes gene_type:complete